MPQSSDCVFHSLRQIRLEGARHAGSLPLYSQSCCPPAVSDYRERKPRTRNQDQVSPRQPFVPWLRRVVVVSAKHLCLPALPCAHHVSHGSTIRSGAAPEKCSRASPWRAYARARPRPRIWYSCWPHREGRILGDDVLNIFQDCVPMYKALVPVFDANRLDQRPGHNPSHGRLPTNTPR
jgi:hypothetical protein